MVASPVLDGQLSLFEVPAPERIWCPFCHSNIGAAAPASVIENFRGEHAQFESGLEARCGKMVSLGVTEPFYAPSDTPWLSGWSVPYPRPVGFRGLDQLRARNAA